MVVATMQLLALSGRITGRRTIGKSAPIGMLMVGSLLTDHQYFYFSALHKSSSLFCCMAALRNVAKLTHARYGSKSLPAKASTFQNTRMVSARAASSKQMTSRPPRMDCMPKKTGDHAAFKRSWMALWELIRGVN